MDRKSYKIIEIINSTNVLINGGIQQGLKEGETLEIYEPGEVVLDPETNTPLGTLDYIKDRIEIVTTYDNFSLCQKILRTKTNLLNSLDKYMTTNIHVARLNVNKEQITDRKVQGNPIISVGDLVRRKS